RKASIDPRRSDGLTSSGPNSARGSNLFARHAKARRIPNKKYFDGNALQGEFRGTVVAWKQQSSVTLMMSSNKFKKIFCSINCGCPLYPGLPYRYAYSFYLKLSSRTDGHPKIISRRSLQRPNARCNTEAVRFSENVTSVARCTHSAQTCVNSAICRAREYMVRLQRAIDEALSADPIVARSLKFQHECEVAMSAYRDLYKDFLLRAKQTRISDFFMNILKKIVWHQKVLKYVKEFVVHATSSIHEARPEQAAVCINTQSRVTLPPDLGCAGTRNIRFGSVRVRAYPKLWLKMIVQRQPKWDFWPNIDGDSSSCSSLFPRFVQMSTRMCIYSGVCVYKYLDVIYTDVTNRYFDQLRLKRNFLRFSMVMRFSENFYFSRENRYQTCQAKCLELRVTGARRVLWRWKMPSMSFFTALDSRRKEGCSIASLEGSWSPRPWSIFTRAPYRPKKIISVKKKGFWLQKSFFELTRRPSHLRVIDLDQTFSGDSGQLENMPCYVRLLYLRRNKILGKLFCTRDGPKSEAKIKRLLIGLRQRLYATLRERHQLIAMHMRKRKPQLSLLYLRRERQARSSINNIITLLLLYDVTNKQSFDNIRAWLGEIREYAQDDVVIMLLGNKCDCGSDRVVRKEDGQRLASEYKVPFMETSAKTGLNVELAFHAVARELKARAKSQQDGHSDEGSFNVHDYLRQHQAQRSDNCFATNCLS
ncbi:unnamed protein product, partial [Trichogramma brassicae]